MTTETFVIPTPIDYPEYVEAVQARNIAKHEWERAVEDARLAVEAAEKAAASVRNREDAEAAHSAHLAADAAEERARLLRAALTGAEAELERTSRAVADRIATAVQPQRRVEAHRVLEATRSLLELVEYVESKESEIRNVTRAAGRAAMRFVFPPNIASELRRWLRSREQAEAERERWS
jgi:hypothetical protein